MEEENRGAEQKRTAPGTGEQYLAALIKCADWVARPYKQLAEKNRANTEVLKELYMCACDGVPAEKAIEAQKKNPPEGALRFLRRKHIETMALGNYSDELSGIREITSTLEREIRMMSDMLTHIVNHVPNFDAMFPEEQRQMQEREKEDYENPAQEQRQYEEPVRDPDTKQSEERVKEHKMHIKGSVLEAGIQKIRGWKKVRKPRRKRIPDFMGELLDDGYSSEQLDYILDCMEDGADLEDIKRFASPKLPVDLMRRLRMLEERKEIGNGK